MIGAIIGDIIGSPYEFHNIETTEFPLFSERSKFTDDTILTVALADSIMNKKNWVSTIHEYYERYLDVGYGRKFIEWAKERSFIPYNSFGNGSAMRTSPIAWLCDDQLALKYARDFAEVTHNHKQGIRGAEMLTLALILISEGFPNWEIEEIIERNYYSIPTMDEIKEEYDRLLNNRKEKFHIYSCDCSVPHAIRCYFEGSSYEEIVRIAVSIRGDSDTLACMAGSLAEMQYGIPKEIQEKGLSYLDEHLLKIVNQFKEYVDYK